MNVTRVPSIRGLAVFAHELREPLASILLAVESMREAPHCELTCQEMYGVVERQGQFLARMIDEALEVCRDSSDRLRLQRDWFELNATLASALESTRPLFTRRGHRLTISLPAERVYVFADAARVQQVAINLLANAAKYTRPGGSITLDAVANENLTMIRVGDNGIGIAKASLRKIFEPFHQVESSHRAEFSGLGIGLALVKAIVDLHGGTVEAQSAGEGLGSIFSVRLPGATSRLHRGAGDFPFLSESTGIRQGLETNFMADA